MSIREPHTLNPELHSFSIQLKRDEVRGLDWLQKAATSGSPQAQLELSESFARYAFDPKPHPIDPRPCYAYMGQEH
jgi:hypothetical protein